MITSKYIADILELILDGDMEGLGANDQIKFITEKKFDYTNGGMFVSFNFSEDVFKYRASKPNLILDGVKITSHENSIEASATLFFKNGIIDYLEIWCYSGDYPKYDLTKYTLTQVWNNSPQKIISTE